MEKIDLDRFVACLLAGVDDNPRTKICAGHIYDALQDQGLEYRDGKIVKSEAKSCEDSKVRDEIISYLRSTIGDEDIILPWITWLEKQGEKKSIISNALITAFDSSKKDYSLEEKKEASNYSESVLPTSVTYGESKEEYMLHTIIESAFIAGQNIKQKPNKCDGCNNIKGCITCTNGDQWAHITEASTIELSDDENPTYKKPKFKIGDWIVSGKSYFKILSIERESNGILDYILLEPSGNKTAYNKKFVDENFHLWTIQDAKDGDVLVDGNFVGLFKENNYNSSDESGCTYLYCSFDIGNNEFYTESGGYNPTYLYPAIKEQCTLLFSKMKESGYEWDPVNKKVKKIDNNTNKSIRGEDYGIDGLWHAQKILEETLGTVDGYQSDDGILEHKAAIGAVRDAMKKM